MALQRGMNPSSEHDHYLDTDLRAVQCGLYRRCRKRDANLLRE